MTLLICLETTSCQQRLKDSIKFISEVETLQQRQTSLQCLWPLSTIARLTTLHLTSSALSALTIVITVQQPRLCLSVQPMPTATVFQLSHGQKLNSLSSDILLAITKLTTRLKKTDAWMDSRKSSRTKELPEVLSLQLSLSQSAVSATRWPLLASSKCCASTLKTRASQ